MHLYMFLFLVLSACQKSIGWTSLPDYFCWVGAKSLTYTGQNEQLENTYDH